jgi:hypothetical protein
MGCLAMNVSKMSLSFSPCIGNLRSFIDFSFYGERDIMEKILKWMDSRRKSGKIGGGVMLWAWQPLKILLVSAWVEPAGPSLNKPSRGWGRF